MSKITETPPNNLEIESFTLSQFVFPRKSQPETPQRPSSDDLDEELMSRGFGQRTMIRHIQLQTIQD